MIESVGASCAGCSACAAVCPKGCITFEQRELGHSFPVVDEASCVHCGKCRNVCPALTSHEAGPFTGRAYAFQALDTKLLADSSSGGAFGVLSSNWIANGGVVYGAAWRRGSGAHHMRASTQDGLAPLRRSKYVQSSLDGIYGELLCDLASGTDVLFVGTPCQVAAVKAVSRWAPRRGRLVTVDLVCHGVPSAALFEDYIDWMEARTGSVVSEYASRDKVRAGWSYLGSVSLDGAEAREHRADDPYVMLFGQGAVFRSSCYTCPYACAVRVGDLTLGDFWGAESFDLGFDLDLGLSAVLVNSEIGHMLLESCSHDARMVAVTFDDIACNNSNLLHPSEAPAKYEGLADVYEREGFSGLAETASSLFRVEASKNRIKQLLPTSLKRALKRTLVKRRRHDR